jgi:hypothetical protein
MCRTAGYSRHLQLDSSQVNSPRQIRRVRDTVRPPPRAAPAQAPAIAPAHGIAGVGSEIPAHSNGSPVLLPPENPPAATPVSPPRPTPATTPLAPTHAGEPFRPLDSFLSHSLLGCFIRRLTHAPCDDLWCGLVMSWQHQGRDSRPDCPCSNVRSEIRIDTQRCRWFLNDTENSWWSVIVEWGQFSTGQHPCPSDFSVTARRANH